MSSLALLAVAAAAGTGASWTARTVAVRLAFVSAPHPLVSAHREPIPYLGGVAVAAGALFALAAFRELAEVGVAAIVGGLSFLVVGLLDDVRPHRPGRKLVLQTGCAALAISLGLGLPLTGIEAVDALAGLAWILVVVNAVNVTDVCDGLVAGLAVIAFLAFAFSDLGARPLALAVAGACLGFLVFNAPPASIFLGDAGSHFLGYCLAVPTLASAGSPAASDEIVAGMLILGVPLFELAFVVAVRIHKGVPYWRGSTDHFSLRLQSAGLSRWQTDVLAWSAAAALALAGVTLLRVDAPGGVALVTGVQTCALPI